MFGKYNAGQSAPFVGQFIPTGTLDTTNARRRGPPEQPTHSYVHPRDIYYDYDYRVNSQTRESTSSQLDPYATYAYSDYNSPRYEPRVSTPGPSSRADRRGYTPEYDSEYNHDDDDDGDEDYYAAPTRQGRGHDRPSYPSGSRTPNPRSQEPRRDSVTRRCPYIDPETGVQCSKYTPSGQERRRHWVSTHEYTELLAMTKGSLPEGEGCAITSLTQLRLVREKLACPKCGQIFTRHDAQTRHMAAFNH